MANLLPSQTCKLHNPSQARCTHDEETMTRLPSKWGHLVTPTSVQTQRTIPRTLIASLSTTRRLQQRKDEARRPPPTKISTVHKGTLFEHRAAQVLRTDLSMSLDRVGGRGDEGVDLEGWWWLPDFFSPKDKDNGEAASSMSSTTTEIPERHIRIRILAQCKAEKKQIGPKYVRELEGTFLRYEHSLRTRRPVRDVSEEDETRTGVAHSDFDVDANTDTDADTTILAAAVLVSESKFSDTSIRLATSSHVPLLLIHLPPLTSPHSQSQSLTPPQNKPKTTPNPDSIGGAIWNPALCKKLLQNKFELRWERMLDGMFGSGRPALWKDGKRVGCCIPGGNAEDGSQGT